MKLISFGYSGFRISLKKLIRVILILWHFQLDIDKNTKLVDWEGFGGMKIYKVIRIAGGPLHCLLFLHCSEDKRIRVVVEWDDL